ncbi:MAG: HAMP domain-containing histidine kinase [Actinobacteria bacterium]|nr:HAMP domain-containing histidine kinase [Actinomycetota bacterium]
MRGRLSLLALAVTSMVVIAFLVPLGLLVRNQAAARALDDGQQTARSVASGLAVAASLSGGVDGAVADLVVAVAGNDATTVFLPDGAVTGAPAGRSAAVDLAATGRALTADVEGGVEVLVPVVGVGEAVVVRVFVSGREMSEGVLGATLALAALGLLLIAAAVLLADRLGRTMVRPIADLADAAHRMAGGDLTARVEPAGPPETAEVGAAFNHLADRVDELIVEERESLADLSHGLRTPLTSLRLQAEMLADQDEAAPMLEDLDRISAQVDGLIAEARRRSPAAGARDADLAAVVRDRFRFWSVLAEEQQRPHALTAPDGPLPVAATEAELAAAVDTALENVFAHTPPGTAYRVTVTPGTGEGTLVVEDDGPGFPGHGVLARGASGAGSTGLGLDIIRRAAERSGGRLTLGTGPGGGARVEAAFGRARP